MIGPITFESPEYSTGAVDGQDGWRSAGSLDHEIDDAGATGTEAGSWGFGAQALRVSNAVVGESATDQTVSRPTLDHSGEVTNGDVDGVRRGFFETSWSFATAGDPQVEQEDLAVVASPDRGDGSPMSWVQMADCSLEDNADPAFCLADGLEVNVSEYDTDTGAIVARNVATGLSRSEPHKVRRAHVLLRRRRQRRGRGVRRHDAPAGRSGAGRTSTGTATPARPVSVDSVTFGAEGPAVPETAGAGFFIDNFVAKAIAGSGATASVSGPAVRDRGRQRRDRRAVHGSPSASPCRSRSRCRTRPSTTPPIAPDDYTETSGSVTFAPGETVEDGRRCPCTVTPTTRSTSGSRSCSARRSRPVEGPAPRRGPRRPADGLEEKTTVLDDDSTIRIDDVTSDEPPWGNEPASFTVHLDNPSARPVTVRFSTEDRSATAPDDYTAVTNALVTLPPGVVSKAVPVTIKSDTEEEDDERFVGHLHDATGGEIATADADARIRNTDQPDPPNIVMVMTDDQTVEMMRFMTRTKALLGDEGTTFTNSFVNFPLCCPSRATYLTGQYSHNHGVRSNDAPDGGYHKLDHTNTLPVWLEGRRLQHGPRRQVPARLRRRQQAGAAARLDRVVRPHRLLDLQGLRLRDEPQRRGGPVRPHAGGLPDRRAGRHRGGRHRTAGSRRRSPSS